MTKEAIALEPSYVWYALNSLDRGEVISGSASEEEGPAVTRKNAVR